MAFGSGFERQNSTTWLSAALDGIEIKVGESFKPPRRVTLPINYLHKNPSEALSLDYDFRHENSVLEMAKKRKEYQQAMEAQRRAENEASSSPSPTNGVTDADASPPAEQVSLPRPPTNPALASFDPLSILQPQPAAPNTQDSRECKPKAPASFKITDFEGESSPFDDMELKTINVMEELKTVLDSNVCSDGEERQDSNGAERSAEKESVEVTVARKHGSRVAFKARSETGTKADSNGIPNGVIPSAAATSKMVAANNPFLKNSPLPPIPHTTSPELDASHPHGLPYPTHSDTGAGLFSDFPNPGSRPVDVAGYMRHDLHDGASNGPLPAGSSSLPSAVSNPLYEQVLPLSPPSSASASPGLEDERTSSDSTVRSGQNSPRGPPLPPLPPRTTSSPNQVLPSGTTQVLDSGVEVDSFGLPLNPFPPLPPTPSASAADVREPECLRSLDASGKRFVTSITGMGFPVERVARAVQNVGQDEKKVGSYLSLLLKFEEMGFPQDKIKEALIVCSNDEHKALDMLMS
uniref:UBA domain-containing protein n=1 Tax=Branchiostoma floridae TaxID=7739 RepID=C3ZGP6_BRAFL|eukprot:XP_002592261.1 hypothetical protein BRAFLDRAFT_119625 [Branchiostoma floridae]